MWFAQALCMTSSRTGLDEKEESYQEEDPAQPSRPPRKGDAGSQPAAKGRSEVSAVVCRVWEHVQVK